MPPDRPLTDRLVEFVVRSRWEDVPAAVRHDARRALVNVIGTALGARHDASADADGAAVRHRIVVRGGYVLTLQHRLVDGARVYRILSFQERDNGRFIEIDAELRVE